MPTALPTLTPSATPSRTSSSGASTPSASPTPHPAVGDYLGALSLVADTRTEGMPALRDDLVAALRVTRSISPAPAEADRDLPPGYANHCERRRGESRVVGPDECLSGDPAGRVRVALVGDSKMDQWQPAFDLVGRRHGWQVQNLSKSGCAFSSRPQGRDCDDYNAALLQRLVQRPPAIVVVSSMMFYPGTAPGMADLLAKVRARGAKVVLVADNPSPPAGTSVYQCLETADDPALCEFSTNDGSGTSQLTEVHESLPGSTMVSLNRWICPPGRATCPSVVGNVLIYRQTNHLTNSYVLTLTPLLERTLVSVGVLDRVTIPLQP